MEVPQEHVVHLSFDVFVMEKCAIPSPTCSCDHVEIRDGPNIAETKIPVQLCHLEDSCGLNSIQTSLVTHKVSWQHT